MADAVAIRFLSRCANNVTFVSSAAAESRVTIDSSKYLRQGMPSVPYDNWNMNMGWGGALLMMLFTLVFLGGVLWIAMTVVRQHHHHEYGYHAHGAHPTGGRSAALKILDERFARGEIDEEEYKRRCALL